MENLNSEKKVLVTGASGGIGRAIAVEAAKEGYYVICHYNGSKGKAEETLAMIKSCGGNGELIQFDVSNREECKVKLDEMTEKHGVLWGIVNNAGITRDGLSFRMKLEDWNDVLKVNLTSAFLISQIISSDMIRKRKGSIINMSSIVGLHGQGGQVNYAASKAGLIGFTKSLAKEVAGRGVRVNAIAPGFIDTEMTQAVNEEARNAWLETIPMKKAGSTRDVANTALFLASDISSYVTAQVIGVDGGMGA